MQLLVAAICDAATDYQGKLCLLGAFDTIRFKQLPGHHPQCFVALRFVSRRSTAGLHTVEIRFLDPDDNLIVKPIKAQSTVVLPPGNSFISNNIIVMLQNLRFEKTGVHGITVSVDGEAQTTIPLTVQQRIKQQETRTN